MIDRLIVNILEWAAGHADEGRYSPVGFVFHWTRAAIVLFQLYRQWPPESFSAVRHFAAWTIAYLPGLYVLLRR